MYVTNVVGPTQGVTAILCSSQSSGNGREIEIATPINVQTHLTTLTNNLCPDYVIILGMGLM